MNRILIVEDDAAISEGVQINLEYAGYACRAFGDGQAAADSLAADHSYDLALLDIMLPGLDGYQLIPYVRQYGIPVIYLTAKNDAASEIQGLRDGAEDYVVKPFEMMTLLVRIEKVLQREGKLNSVLRFQDIEIDTANRSVKKGGEDVPLTPLEFDLAALLVRYANRTIPREKLLSEVWGTDFFGDTRTIDVHIAHLRKKLDIGDQLKTVAKVGYRLEG